MRELICQNKPCPHKVTIEWAMLKSEDRKSVVDFMRFLISKYHTLNKDAPITAVEADADNRCLFVKCDHANVCNHPCDWSQENRTA